MISKTIYPTNQTLYQLRQTMVGMKIMIVSLLKQIPIQRKMIQRCQDRFFKERISWTSLMMIRSVITLPSLARQMTKAMIPILCKKKLLFLREFLFIPPITWRNSPHLNVSIAHPSPFQNSQQPDLNFAKV